MMLVRKQIAVLLMVVSLFVSGCTPRTKSPKPDESQGIVEQQEVPADFKIVARYSPGYSPNPGWDSTIGADGGVTQHIWGARGSVKNSTKQSQLAKNELDALWSKVKQAHFFQLKKEYKAAVTDQATRDLEITRNKETHRVSVYAYSEIKENRSEVDRFFALWSEITMLVPPPPEPD